MASATAHKYSEFEFFTIFHTRAEVKQKELSYSMIIDHGYFDKQKIYIYRYIRRKLLAKIPKLKQLIN